MQLPTANLHTAPLRTVGRRFKHVAGAFRSAKATLYAAHEASTMEEPNNPANQRRLRELGLL